MERFLEKEWGCNDQYRAIQIGQLTQVLHEIQADRGPTDWFERISLDSIQKRLQLIEPLIWGEIHEPEKEDRYPYGYSTKSLDAHKCPTPSYSYPRSNEYSG